MQESAESVKRLLTSISQYATDHNIICLAQILNYNEKQLRQDIKAIDFVNITDRPRNRDQLIEQENLIMAARYANKGSYFLRKYILEHPEITGAKFKWYDLYEYTGHVTGTGNVSVFVNVLYKDWSIETEDRDVLIDWTFTNTPFDEIFKDPEKASAEHTVKFANGTIVFGHFSPPKGSRPNCEREIFARSETGALSLSFTSYKEFIQEVRLELMREGHTDYEILD